MTLHSQRQAVGRICWQAVCLLLTSDVEADDNSSHL